MKNIEVSDLDAVAHFKEYLVLSILSEDENIPTSLCVQVNFDTEEFDLIQPLSLYIKSIFYLLIQDEDTRISHRQRIKQEMSENVIGAILADFAQKKCLYFKKMGISNNKTTGWVPGG